MAGVLLRRLDSCEADALPRMDSQGNAIPRK